MIGFNLKVKQQKGFDVIVGEGSAPTPPTPPGPTSSFGYVVLTVSDHVSPTSDVLGMVLRHNGELKLYEVKEI